MASSFRNVNPVTNLLAQDPDEETATSQIATNERRQRDEEVLTEYAIQHQKGAKKTGPKKSDRAARREARAKVAGLIAGGFDGETFADRLARRASVLGLTFPEVTIDYKDIRVTTDALVGSAALPSLTRAAKSQVQRLVRPKAVKTQQVKVLDGVSGVLKPGRLTLLLGPPKSGKSTFLKLLAGRMGAETALHTEGTVTYNGHSPDAFNLTRTAAYVDQHDQHVASLTVADTLAFAYKCQTGTRGARSTGAPARPAAHDRGKRAGSESSGGAAADAGADDGDSLATDAAEHVEADEEVDLSFLETGEVPPGGISDAQFDAMARAVVGTKVQIGVIMKLLGLWHVQHTVVGSELRRGVSGGERHRVTTAEMIVGPRSVLMMDEISTGLDSATLFSIITMLSNFTSCFQFNTLIALLQPPPEVIDLFADIILITGGIVVYHGPVDDAIPFLESCGFKCPPNKDRGSFMQEVTGALGQLEFATAALRAERSLPSLDQLADVLKGTVACPYDEPPVPAHEMAAAFWRSPHGRAMREELDAGLGVRRGSPESLVVKKYALTTWQMIKLVSERQLKLVLNQRGLNTGRMIQVTVVALIIGTLWYSLDVALSNARSFFAVAFMSTVFLTLGCMPQVELRMRVKPVYLKHRDNYFYSAIAYAIAVFWSHVPLSLLECAVFTTIIYFLAAFTASAGAYFTFLGSAVLLVWSFSSMLRVIASAAPTRVVSNAVSTLVLMVTIMFGGFAVVRGAVPGWWIWAFYMSPLSWALQGIVINEMTQERWSDVNADGNTIGELALASFDFRTNRQWIWWGWLYMATVIVVFTYINSVVLSIIKPARSPAFVADERALAQYKETTAARKQAQSAKGQSGPLAFEPVTITFIDLNYFVPNPDKSAKEDLQLLRGITGSVRPGKLCALMGGSGAGKTTFCDVIAGRKNVGHTTGDILVNGHAVDRQAWARRLGYVQQMDIHSPQLTVAESLVISAQLRLGRDVSTDAVQSQVAATLQMVDLVEMMESIVGDGNGVGLSTEQRKRLTIAVELVANPSAVFMDEPTSGLDARAAAIVIRSVKSVAESGRTVMVVVHQPSIDIFYAFDVLLLLARGGRPVFFGDLGNESTNLVSYLESIPGTPKLEPGYNPATWMLKVTGGSMASSSSARDYPAEYRASQLCAANRAAAEADAATGRATGRRLTVDTKYAATWATQFRVLLRKFSIIYWRKPDYNLVRFVLTVVTALILGTTYLGEGDVPEPAEIGDVQNVNGLHYIIITFYGLIKMMTVMPLVSQERAVFYRERSSGMYSALPFSLAAGLVELPYILAQCLLFCPIVFFLVRFDNSDGWQYWYWQLMVYLTISMYCYMGQFLAYATASQEIAMILAVGLNFVYNVFNGFARPFPGMPIGWKWMNRIVPTTWVLYGLGVAQLGGNDGTFVTADGRETTVAQFTEDFWGYEYGFRWYCVLIILAWVIFFKLMSALALKFLRFQTT